MYEPVTVCTLAWNEEGCIADTLRSISTQDYPGELEILVGVNGSTDGTADRVREMADIDPRIRLIEIEEQGKPNAWNITREEASHNYVVFTDGDVYLDPSAVNCLVGRMDSSPEMIAVGALPLPFREKCDYLTSLLNPTRQTAGSIVGRLYGVRNDALQRALKESEYVPHSKMPKDIIHEDAWVSIVVGKDKWVIEPESKVYYTPYHWTEEVRLRTRYVRAAAQLKKIFGDRYDLGHTNGGESFIEGTRRRLGKLYSSEGAGNKANLMVAFVMYRAISFAAHARVFMEKEERSLKDAWRVSENSKAPITRPQYVD